MTVDCPEESAISGDVEILIDSKWHSCHAELIGQSLSIEIGTISAIGGTIPSGIRHVVVKKEDGQGLGLSIKGGKEKRFDSLLVP